MRTWLAPAAITLVGAVVRFPGARPSLWLHALAAARVLHDGLAPVPRRAWLNTLSPVFYWLTGLPVAMLGRSEIAYRLPALLAGVAIIPAGFLLARRLTGSSAAALVAAAVLALFGTLVDYSQDARP